MNKEKLVRKAFENALVVRCALDESTLAVLPLDVKLKRDNGDFFFTSEIPGFKGLDTNDIFLTHGDQFAEVVVGFESNRLAIEPCEMQDILKWKGTVYTVQEFAELLSSFSTKEMHDAFLTLAEDKDNADGLPACGCPENELTGIAPTVAEQTEWLKKLTENGIVQGVEFRAVEGADAGRILKFDTPKFNDHGIYVDGTNGYVLFRTKNTLMGVYGDDFKVAKPLYKLVQFCEARTNKNYGCLVRQPYIFGTDQKAQIVSMAAGHVIVTNEPTKAGSQLPVETSRIHADFADMDKVSMGVRGGILYEFQNREDLYEWLSIKN